MLGDMSFRAMYQELENHDAPRAQSVLWDWFDRALSLLEPLRKYGHSEAKRWTYICENSVDQAMLGDLYQIYALSRIDDILLLPLQKGSYAGSWQGPDVALDERNAFFSALMDTSP